ncbi:TolC family protein [Persephonella sp.]
MRKIILVLLFPFLANALTIDEAVNKALENNLELKQYKQEIKISTIQLKEDKNLWFPQFFVNYSYTFLKDTPYTKIPPSTVLPFPFSFKQMNKNFYNFEMGLNYPVFTGFARPSKVKISKISIKANKEIYNEQKINITSEVKKAYLDVLMTQAILETYKKQYEAVKSHLLRAEEFYKEGLITKVEVLQSKVKLSQIEMKIKKAEGDLKIAKSNLNMLLNEKLEKDFKVEPVNIEIPENLDFHKLADTAVKNRNIIKALNYRKKGLKYVEKIERSKFYPKIIAQGKYFYSDQYPYLDPKGNIAVSVAINLQFQGIKPYYAILKTKQQRKKLKYQIEELKNKIRLQVKAAYENFEVAKKNLKVAESSLIEAEEYYRMVVEQYKNQLASTTDVLDAEAALTSARKGKVISYYQLLKAFIELEKAVGGKIEK